MKIYFLVPEDELPQDQFDRKALDIEALLRRLGVTRKLTGFQYVCYMVNPSRRGPQPAQFDHKASVSRNRPPLSYHP